MRKNAADPFSKNRLPFLVSFIMGQVKVFLVKITPRIIG